MTLYAKICFFLIIFVSFLITYSINKSNNTRAFQKIFLILFSSFLFLAILFPDTIMMGTASLLGVGRGPDAILYIFIIISFSINMILLKKILDLEYKISKIIQIISLEDVNKSN